MAAIRLFSADWTLARHRSRRSWERLGMNRSLAVVTGDGEGLADDDNNFVADGPPGETPPTLMPRRRLLPWQRLLLRGVLRMLLVA
jgi:hypothetical protein